MEVLIRVRISRLIMETISFIRILHRDNQTRSRTIRSSKELETALFSLLRIESQLNSFRECLLLREGMVMSHIMLRLMMNSKGDYSMNTKSCVQIRKVLKIK